MVTVSHCACIGSGRDHASHCIVSVTSVMLSALASLETLRLMCFTTSLAAYRLKPDVHSDSETQNTHNLLSTPCSSSAE